MEKEIELNGLTIPYTLKANRRSRSIRLTIHYDGRFVATHPYYVSEKDVIKFIVERSSWILKHINVGTQGELSISRSNAAYNFLRHKDQALLYVQERVKHFNKIYNFDINRVYVKNHKAQWGSCTRKGNLNFNFRIFFLSERLSDYVIVHELCHLGEFSHSKRFWELVARILPNYKRLEKKLRDGRLLEKPQYRREYARLYRDINDTKNLTVK